MNDYEFGQAVMAAAGCTTKRRGCGCDAQWCRSPEYCDGMKPFPDPLTAAGFDALWDALVAKGFTVQVTVDLFRDRASAGVHDRTYTVSAFKCRPVADRKAALLEAAAAALGVVRS